MITLDFTIDSIIHSLKIKTFDLEALKISLKIKTFVLTLDYSRFWLKKDYL